jgi:restriction system protein
MPGDNDMRERDVWVVRAGPSGRYADSFKRLGIVALVVPFAGRATDATLASLLESGETAGRAPQVAALLRSFVSGLKSDDIVISPGPRGTKYLVGIVSGPYRYVPEEIVPGVRHVRDVTWSMELEAVQVPQVLRNALGSPMVLYRPGAQVPIKKHLASVGGISQPRRAVH